MNKKRYVTKRRYVRDDRKEALIKTIKSENEKLLRNDLLEIQNFYWDLENLIKYIIEVDDTLEALALSEDAVFNNMISLKRTVERAYDRFKDLNDVLEKYNIYK